MNIPDSLFKYSAYKDYSEKMIKTGSIYLCPGDKLDDQFECLVDWSKYDNVTANKVYNLLKRQMKKKKIAVPDINIQKLYEGNVLNREKARKILKISYKNIKSENVEKFLDYIDDLPSLVDSPEYHKYLEEVTSLNKKIGMFCMSSKNDSQVMWATYANNSSGYCIEYDIKKALNENIISRNDILRVRYKYKRDADPIDLVLEFVISRLKSNKELNDNERDEIKKLVIDIISTKHREWNFQKEWRIVGKPEDESIILPIKALYLGNKMDKKIKDILISACNESVPIYEQKNDYVNLKISFELIDRDKYIVGEDTNSNE